MVGKNKFDPYASWLHRISRFPRLLLHYFTSPALGGLALPVDASQRRASLRFSKETYSRRKKELKAVLGKTTASEHGILLNASEELIVDSIRRETERANRNNVDRTAAYWSVYRQHPELHWALLAHMVSRNGGWNMTDLKGELLPHLLTEAQREQFFLILDKANALIFQDAYPQLLLYRESRAAERNLFHLLPSFYVSSFMGPFWNAFWLDGDSVPLTTALIINEQNYIENRVIGNPQWTHDLLKSPAFRIQSLLQLNQIIFPYAVTSVRDHFHEVAGAKRMPLSGLILEQFSNLQERIEVGKKLYAILYLHSAVHRGVLAFASAIPHSGSRSDYWPHLFDAQKKASPIQTYQEKLQGGSLRKGAHKLYSPKLKEAWPDQRIIPPRRDDWFTNLDMLRHLGSIDTPLSFDMTHEFCFGLNKIELAVKAGQLLK